MTKKSDEQITPPELYRTLDMAFKFKTDLATMPHNPQNAPSFYTKQDDALSKIWDTHGSPYFCNPPYSEPEKWVRKAYDDVRAYGSIVVMLLPSDTSTNWLHHYCAKGLIGFIRGRLTFVGNSSPARFSSMITIFSPRTLANPSVIFLDRDRLFKPDYGLLLELAQWQ